MSWLRSKDTLDWAVMEQTRNLSTVCQLATSNKATIAASREEVCGEKECLPQGSKCLSQSGRLM